MKHTVRSNLPAKTVPALIVLAAVLLSLFQPWEPSIETWGYWLFSRIWAETGKVIIMDRSPPYVVYLALFRWVGYPLSLDGEYMVTSFIAAGTLFLFSRSFFSTPLALLTSVLWIPYMQVSEPPTQKLALAASMGAVLVRYRRTDRFRFVLSYALLGIAYMFRPTYLIPVLLFAATDIARGLRRPGWYRSLRIQPKTDWPILGFFLFFLYVQLAQSSHPWNTIWFATARWFPYDGKTFELLVPYNAYYIYRNYATLPVPDFYFTNQDLFHGAKTTVETIRANPGFLRDHIGEFVTVSIPVLANMSFIPHLGWPVASTTDVQGLAILLPLFGAVMASARNRILRIYMVGSVSVILVSVVYGLQSRYLFPIIPVYILSAHWYGEQVNRIIRRRWQNRMILLIAPALFLFLFSSSRPLLNRNLGWHSIFDTVLADLPRGRFPLTERTLLHQSAPLIDRCRGVLSLDYVFIGAFTDIPLAKLYDIWEIPPFGDFGHPAYNGLTPERIDCIVMSQDLEYGLGFPTNSQIRYRNYILPYMQFLETKGAKTVEIPGYGRAVILPPESAAVVQ